MTQSINKDSYTTLISQVMDIDDVTWGDPKRDYLVRFRGSLKTDKIAAKTLLTDALAVDNLAPIIRTEDGLDSILLISDPITTIVSQVFDIQDTTWAPSDQIHLVRFIGRLTQDSMEAYEFLQTRLEPRELTPIFREEEGQHAIILLKGVNRPKASNPTVNLVMFLLTLLSVIFVGAMNTYEGTAGTLTEYLRDILANFDDGLPFAISLLAILLAHEFGHYIAGRLHKTPVTLPYFLPLPFPPFGTLGAFIQLKAAPKNKRILHDIGIAGPLAGLVVAIPVLLIGLNLSTVDSLPLWIPEGQGFTLEGNSILYLLAKFAVFGEWLPAPSSYGDINPILYWLQFFFTGNPLPLGGTDVLIHPVALAGWGGLLVTSLNLIPVGQLDGGHVAYVLFGKRARRFIPYVLVALIGLGFIWQGWWLWAIIISVFGRAYAEPLDQITPLDPRRKAIAIFGLVVFVLVFTPIPLQLLTGPLV